MQEHEPEQPKIDTSPEQVRETRERFHLGGIPEHSLSPNDANSGLDGTDIDQSAVRPTRESLDSEPDPNDADTPLRGENEGNADHR